jgi:hypothetical protein
MNKEMQHCSSVVKAESVISTSDQKCQGDTEVLTCQYISTKLIEVSNSWSLSEYHMKQNKS